jgi:hypothetical protein
MYWGGFAIWSIVLLHSRNCSLCLSFRIDTGIVESWHACRYWLLLLPRWILLCL